MWWSLFLACTGGSPSSMSHSTPVDTGSASATSADTSSAASTPTAGTASTGATGDTGGTAPRVSPCDAEGDPVVWAEVAHGVFQGQSARRQNRVEVGVFADETSLRAWIAGLMQGGYPTYGSPPFDVSGVDWSSHDVLAAVVSSPSADNDLVFGGVSAVGPTELCVETVHVVPDIGIDMMGQPWALATVPKGMTVGVHHATTSSGGTY